MSQSINLQCAVRTAKAALENLVKLAEDESERVYLSLELDSHVGNSLEIWDGCRDAGLVINPYPGRDWQSSSDDC